MGVCDVYADKSHLLSLVIPVHCLPFPKAEENVAFRSRNDKCYLERHIRLLPSAKELQQVIIMSTIYLSADSEVKMRSSHSGGLVSD